MASTVRDADTTIHYFLCLFLRFPSCWEAFCVDPIVSWRNGSQATKIDGATRISLCGSAFANANVRSKAMGSPYAAFVPKTVAWRESVV